MRRRGTAALVFLAAVCLKGDVLEAGRREASKSLPKPERVRVEEIAGRRVVRFENECPMEWGYEKGQRQYFYVIEPKDGSPKHPLLVCLHSAGGTGESEMPSNVQRIAAAGDDFVGLIPNSKFAGDWWWGRETLMGEKEKYAKTLTPAETRVLATIEWVARTYDIDRERIYLHGISMGGSGVLGLGIPHGDIFAALLAGVPAGVDHMLSREPSIDPPPALVFFSQKDTWSLQMDKMLEATRSNRYAFVGAWGPWGHLNHYEMTNPAAYGFPWLSIRRNEAYPVFTNASTDERYPGFQSDDEDQRGQINAYFRWTSLRDEPRGCAMEIRLVTSAELGSAVHLPAEAVTDITLRRLQGFRVKAGREYHWAVEVAGKKTAGGRVGADSHSLITVRRVTVTGTPVRLSVW